MPLHAKTDSKATPNADVYGAAAADLSGPKYKLGDHEMRADVAHALVRDELFLDGNARQNLSTFCQTWLDEPIHSLMNLSLDKNMMDKDEYPATSELESRCVHILADLWHSPKAADTIGCSTTGSSEACMLGGLALKWQWRSAAAARPNFRRGVYRDLRASLDRARDFAMIRRAGELDVIDAELVGHSQSGRLTGCSLERSRLEIKALDSPRSQCDWTPVRACVPRGAGR